MRTRSSNADPMEGGENDEQRGRQAPARPAPLPPPPPRRDDDHPREDRPAPPPRQQQQNHNNRMMPPQPPPRQQEGDQQQAAQPPPPPPVPPEAPQLPPPVNNDNNSNSNNNNNEKDRWILQVRQPRQRSIRRIQMHAGMDTATLACCLQQALELRGGCDGGADLLPPIAGLFQESTETFLPLEDIVRLHGVVDDAGAGADVDRQPRKLIYALELPERPAPPRKRSWWEREWILYAAVPLASIGVVHRHSRDVLHWIEMGAVAAYHAAIEWPLRETYRSGPWFLGWEGEPLSRICARITFHGDEAFWERNMVECRRIYDAKEQAWLRLARPVVVFFMAVFAVWALRLLIREWRRHHHRQERPVDRDMVDLFRAFTVITRQVHRVTAEQHAEHRQQNSRREDQLRRR